MAVSRYPPRHVTGTPQRPSRTLPVNDWKRDVQGIRPGDWLGLQKTLANLPEVRNGK